MLCEINTNRLLRAVTEGLKEIICDDEIVKILIKPVSDHIDWALEDCEVRDEP